MTQNELQEFEQAKGLVHKIKDHTDSFLTAHGLTHAWISKYYFDGRYVDLLNDISWKEKMIANKFYNTFITDFIEPFKGKYSQSHSLTWQVKPSKNTHFFEVCFNHGMLSGFNILKVCDDHVENYGFGTDRGIFDVAGNLPRQEELDLYCLYVRESIWQNSSLKNLVLGETGHCFSLSSEVPMARGYVAPIPQSFSFSCNNLTRKLTREQVIYIGLLARGYAHKDIARVVDLSHRTIESYIQRIKHLYDNPSNLRLITAFNESPLANLNPHLLHCTR